MGASRTSNRRGLPRLFARSAFGLYLLVSLAFLGVTALPRAFGAQTRAITSGSMRPAIDPGDAVIVVDAEPDLLQVGDVIAFVPSSGAGVTTHRISSIAEVGGTLAYQTKGDANGAPDPDLVPAPNVLGKVSMTLPAVGRLAGYAALPWVKILMLVVPVLFIVAREVTSLVAAFHKSRHADVAPPIIAGDG